MGYFEEIFKLRYGGVEKETSYDVTIWQNRVSRGPIVILQCDNYGKLEQRSKQQQNSASMFEINSNNNKNLKEKNKDVTKSKFLFYSLIALSFYMIKKITCFSK